MAEAVQLLEKYDDFKAFCITPEAHSTTICKIACANLYRNKEGDRIRFQITANRFLRGMIRIIVGKLLQIGSGEMKIEEFEALLIHKITPPKFDVAHPQGLFLSEIKYPFLDISPRSSFALHQNTEWVKI